MSNFEKLLEQKSIQLLNDKQLVSLKGGGDPPPWVDPEDDDDDDDC
ncbi:MAG: hypothetical protein MRY78_20585 [Saprospiraceae bacterium]|nr:hypothetical protein [Saprospiraceae bacterium]